AILGNGAGLQVAQALGAAGSFASQPPLSPVSHLGASAPLPPSPVSRLPSVVPLNQAMRAHIENALSATHGKIEGPAGAAALLKINPHTLRARMRKLGINWSGFRQR
ncbi:MAG TPA: sigma-54-dependent Fis family transcriptional regulator, partial [Phycisphaerae bacterium]|nr:sigma-54-dependent Fis family transcriptional regulator [Phycisphaerae bacterium]